MYKNATASISNFFSGCNKMYLKDGIDDEKIAKVEGGSVTNLENIQFHGKFNS